MDNEDRSGQQQPPGEDGPQEHATLGADEGGSSQPRQARPKGWQRTGVRAVAFVGAAAIATGIGFGAASLARGSSKSATVSAAIPSPLRGNGAFVEDDNLTAQDNQDNILTSTASGLVHIISGGTATGVGVVLTPSGKVLTTGQALRGASKVTAKYVITGATFGVKVIGTDPAADLALLQLKGGGKAFPTVTVGNSANLAASTDSSKQFSWHLPGEVTDTAVGSTGTGDAMTLDVGTLTGLNATTTAGGNKLTGLLESRLQAADQAAGGPLVDLSGQVIGVDVAGSGHGLAINGFAIPINQALAIAKQIDTRQQHHQRQRPGPGR